MLKTLAAKPQNADIYRQMASDANFQTPLSARWPGDVYKLATEFAEVL